jgi:hypothetical protein
MISLIYPLLKMLCIETYTATPKDTQMPCGFCCSAQYLVQHLVKRVVRYNISIHSLIVRYTLTTGPQLYINIHERKHRGQI